MPNERLKDRMGELVSIGLVDSGWNVTAKGYEYCMEFSRHIAPFLRKYGLNGKDRNPAARGPVRTQGPDAES